MINLAGKANADQQIELELKAAGIPIEPALAHHSEVPYTIIGKLGQFSFTRAWYYWVARGQVPLQVAQELYDDTIGRDNIRAAGDAGCRPPAEWAQWLTLDGRQVNPTVQRAIYLAFLKSHPTYDGKELFSDDPESLGARLCVDCYHIDTFGGLERFVAAIKQHRLAELPTLVGAELALGEQR